MVGSFAISIKDPFDEIKEVHAAVMALHYLELLILRSTILA